MRFSKNIRTICLLLILILFSVAHTVFPSFTTPVLSYVSDELNSADDFPYYKDFVCILSEEYGNCVVIKSCDKCILINCGTSKTASRLDDYLKNENIDTIDLFIVTNPVSQNIDGFKNLTSNFKIQQIFIGSVFSIDTEKNAELLNMLNLTQKKNIPVKYLNDDESFNAFNINFSIFTQDKPHKNDINNSTVIKLDVGLYKILFAGNIGYEASVSLAEKAISADVLALFGKISVKPFESAFFKAVNPKSFVISSTQNSNKEYTEQLSLEAIKYNCNVFKTDIYGNITFSFDSTKPVFSKY